MRTNCVICSDFFDEINPVSAALCGHVYHSSCLSIWLSQSHTCPQCRSRITQKNIQRLYFNFPPSTVTNSSELENEISNLKTQLSAQNIKLQACMKEKEDITVFVRQAEKKAKELQQAAYKNESEISELKMQMKSFPKLESKLLKVEQMNVALTNDLQLLNNVQTIVNGTQKDVENILNEYNNGSEATKQLATYCTCLKRELQKVMESKKKLLELNSKLKRDNGLFAAKIKFYEDAMAIPATKVDKSVINGSRFSNLKKTALFEVNDSPVSNKPASSACKNPGEDTSIDVSPLAVQFTKSKFNMHIKTTSNISTKINLRCDDDDGIKFTSNPSASIMKLNDENSIIRTGYNGLGGHSNFIKTSSSFKKVKSLKRKV